MLEQALESAGYTLATGESPWILNHTDTPLLQATLNTIANAVAETGAMEAARLARWLNDATTQTRRLVVGHRDVFASMTGAN